MDKLEQLAENAAKLMEIHAVTKSERRVTVIANLAMQVYTHSVDPKIDDAVRVAEQMYFLVVVNETNRLNAKGGETH